ncbi:MAG: MAPEG family protein [Pseudomonadota bacterium]
MPTLNQLEVTLIFAAIFGVLHVVFTMRVGMYRMNSKIDTGDGGDKLLLKIMRGHGNFVENVPMGLILLLINELNGLSSTWLWALGGVFLFGRLAHYVQFTMDGPFILRPVGMISTMGAILAMAILLLL